MIDGFRPVHAINDHKGEAVGHMLFTHNISNGLSDDVALPLRCRCNRDVQARQRLSRFDPNAHVGMVKVVGCKSELLPTTGRFGMVHGFELPLPDCGTHPDSAYVAHDAELFAKRLNLSAGLDRDAHELGLVEDPERVIVQEPKMHRPAVATHREATIQCAREEHVLGADQDRWLFRKLLPSFV